MPTTAATVMAGGKSTQHIAALPTPVSTKTINSNDWMTGENGTVDIPPETPAMLASLAAISPWLRLVVLRRVSVMAQLRSFS